MKQWDFARFVIRWVAFLVMVGVGLGPMPLHAQTSFGAILGTVTDPSQAAIPGVSITVTNNQTGIARHVETDAVGSYRVDSLLPGMYTVRAEHPGFQLTEATNTQVQVAVITTVNLTMRVGTVTQTVEVTGAAPLLQTASGTVGVVVDNNSVVTLPLNGRDFSELIGLIPGSVGNGVANYQIAGGANYSVSGNRAQQNNYTLDGAYNNEEMFKTYGIQPSIDAIQEFKIQTNITSAEYGQAAGSNVTVATKSGTNQIHGSGFEFWRGDRLAANDWFRDLEGLGNPRFVQNQYGGTMGGPVYIPHVYNGKDRSFWFFDYEAFKVRQGSSTVGILPTAAQLSGDLRDQPPIYDPLTTTQTGTDAQGNPIYTRQQISCNRVLNVICPGRLDPWVKAYMGVFYPSISAPAGTSSITKINPAPLVTDTYQWTVRADQKLRENLSFFSRMSLSNGSEVSVQPLPGLVEPTINNMRNFVASWTLIASPTMVVDWKIAYNRTNLQGTATDPAPGWPAFLAAHPIQGTPVKSAKFPLFPEIFLNGSDLSTPFQEEYPFIGNEYQVIGSLSKIMSKHTIKVGMEYLDERSLDDSNYTSNLYFYPSATDDPQNSGSTGSTLASLLLGLPGGGSRELGDTSFYGRAQRFQPYVQDDIKLLRNLTVNLGLRYEYDQWPVELYDRIGAFDPTTPPNGAYLWAGHNQITGQGPNTRRSLVDPDFNNFAPRLGLSYGITPQTTFRVGFGLFYSSNYRWEAQGERGNWPYAISNNLSGENTDTDGPGTLTPITTFFSPAVLPGPGTTPSSLFTVGRHNRTPYTEQWNGGVQRMLSPSTMLEVNYVGSLGLKESMYNDLNAALPGPGDPGTAAHPDPYGNLYGSMWYIINASNASYNSLQIKLEKRLSHGLQFLSSYAWGHQIDVGGSSFRGKYMPQNPNDIQAERANGQFDTRQVWSFSYFYQLPFGHGKKFLTNAYGPLDQIVRGWEFAGIIHYQTGATMNVLYPYDAANIGPANLTERPDWDGGFPHRIPSSDKRLGWINQANYTPPANYTFGNAGRDLQRGPGWGDYDPALFKNVHIYQERMTLQFRVECFNLLNQHAMAASSISSNYGASDIGTAYATSQTLREIQLALKFLF